MDLSSQLTSVDSDMLKMNNSNQNPLLSGSVSDLQDQLLAGMEAIYGDHLGSMVSFHQKFLEESANRWQESSSGQDQRLVDQVTLLNTYLKVSVPAIQKTLKRFEADYLALIDSLAGAQPEKIKLPLSDEQLEVREEDSPAEGRAKSMKRARKSIGIAPSISIPFRALSSFQLHHQGSKRLLAFQSKLTDLCEDFLEAWASVVIQLASGKLSSPVQPFEALRKLIFEQDLYLKTYLSKSTAYIAELILKDVSSISVNHIKTNNQSRLPEIDSLKASIAQFINHWDSQMELRAGKPLLNLHLERLNENVSKEVNSVKEQAEKFIFSLANAEIVKAEAIIAETEELLQKGNRKAASKLHFEIDDHFSFDDLLLNESLNLMQQYAGELPGEIRLLREDRVEINTDAAYLADYVLDSVLQNALQAALIELPGRCASALSSLVNSLRQIGFTITSKSEETNIKHALDEMLGKAKENAEKARKELADIQTKLEDKMDLLLSEANAHFTLEAITKEGAELGEISRKSDQLSTVASLYGKWTQKTGRLVNKYGRFLSTKKDELIYAEFKAMNAQSESVHARMKGFVESVSPPSEAIEALPFYYQQLFIGKHAPKAKLLHHRNREMKSAMLAVSRWEAGDGGAIMVLGETLSGKTFFCDMICQNMEDPHIYRIDAPQSGSVNPDHLLHMLRHQLNRSGRSIEVIESAPKGSVFLFNDLELWWERSSQGWKVIDLFIKMVERYSRDYLFIVNMNSYAYHLLKKHQGFAYAFMANIPLSPFTLNPLQRALIGRHRTGGLMLEVDGISENELSVRKLRALLDDILDFSEGNIGAAFHLWLGLLTEVRGDVLKMHSPRHRELPDIEDKLWVIVLAQFILHKHLTAKKLGRILKQSTAEAKSLLVQLKRSGLIEELMGGTYRISPYVLPFATKKLKQIQLI